MFDTIKILYHQGKQYIPDLRKAKAVGIFMGRPEISYDDVDGNALPDVCPTGAIITGPVRIDLGRCTFCGECSRLYPGKIQFTTDYRLSVNEREKLIISEGIVNKLTLNPALIRKEIRKLFRGSLKLRQQEGTTAVNLNSMPVVMSILIWVVTVLNLLLHRVTPTE
jgi:hypothetical protein